MNKWGEIKQAILTKLFMTESEAEQQDYLSKFPMLANECLNSIANCIKPNIKILKIDDELITTTEINEVITLPDDFISFADVLNFVVVTDDYGNEITIEDPDKIYKGFNQLILPEIGIYTIYYNATYPVIADATGNDEELDIEPSVLYLIPTYVASQLLQQDDLQRSIILRNEYELMISRLDDTVFYESRSYHSKGGWY